MISPKLLERMLKDQKVRVAVIKESHVLFFHFYFAHYIKYPTAEFQKEIFALTEDISERNLFIVAFRGSSKSTILTTSYPIWSILGRQKKKFVLILGKTQQQAKQHLMNLRRELEANELLKKDLGPFCEQSDEWGATSLVFSKYNARITAISSEQSMRGLRHNQHRPDLIIGDDIEDIESTKTRESRNKTYEWWTGEVIPAGDRNTRIVMVGNLLHEDSLLMRIKTDIEEEKIKGVFRAYPLMLQGDILWPGKYPTVEAIEDERKKIGNDSAWSREFLLVTLPNHEQVIHREWFHFYDNLPQNKESYSMLIIGIDPAISESTRADYSAIVCGLVIQEADEEKLYILPNMINERLVFPDLIDRIESLHVEMKKICDHTIICIESIAFQGAIVDQLKRNGLSECEKITTSDDKWTRLATVSHRIKSGQIVFPRKGAERLIEQIVGFGSEKHDDLMDAFVYCAKKFSSKERPYRFLML